MEGEPAVSRAGPSGAGERRLGTASPQDSGEIGHGGRTCGEPCRSERGVRKAARHSLAPQDSGEIGHGGRTCGEPRYGGQCGPF